ncbi:hypothetical protein M3J09_004981 [Ascochyta lentis]
MNHVAIFRYRLCHLKTSQDIYSAWWIASFVQVGQSVRRYQKYTFA